MSNSILVAQSARMRGLSLVCDLDNNGLGSDGRLVTAKMTLEDLDDLFTNEYTKPNLFVPYQVLDPDGKLYQRFWRLKKEALPQLRNLGAEVLCPILALDIDITQVPAHANKFGKKVPWGDLSEAAQNDLWADVLTPRLPDSQLWAYRTRHGARVVYPLALSVPAGASFEELVRHVHDLYRESNLPVDEACTDWTRMYVAPRVIFEDGIASWESDWYAEAALGEDQYVPDEQYLEVRGGPYKSVHSHFVAEGMPSAEECELMLWETTERGRRAVTHLQTKAKGALEGTSIYPYIFNSVSFSREGHRHDKLTKLVGILVQALVRYHQDWADPALCQALANEATRMVEQDEDWEAKSWNMIQSFWPRSLAEYEESLSSTPEFQSPEESSKSSLGVGEDPVKSSKAELFLEAGDYSTNNDGKPLPTPRNVRLAVSRLGYMVAHDVFADRVVATYNGEEVPLDEGTLRHMWLRAQEEERVAVKKDFFYDTVYDYAYRRRFHPVLDYLDGLEWDGSSRIDRWLTDFFGVEADEYTQAIGRLFLIGAVRRIRHPGSKFDEMLILEGPQGSSKSTALAALMPDPNWFTDDFTIGAGSKEVLEQTAGVWIVEVPELSGISKADINSLKAFLTRQRDKARKAYGRHAEERPRSFMVVGTTNEEKYLRDETGNRRFWPVKVKAGKVKALRQVRDQLWAEAAYFEATGESTFLDPELYHIEEKHQAARRVENPMVEQVLDIFGEYNNCYIPAKEIWDAFGAQKDIRFQMVFGKAMREAGFDKRQMSIPTAQGRKRLAYCYYKGDETTQLRVFERDGKVVSTPVREKK